MGGELEIPELHMCLVQTDALNTEPFFWRQYSTHAYSLPNMIAFARRKHAFGIYKKLYQGQIAKWYVLFLKDDYDATDIQQQILQEQGGRGDVFLVLF